MTAPPWCSPTTTAIPTGSRGRAYVRGRVSYDAGRTWEPGEYLLGTRARTTPGCIATDDGGMITGLPLPQPRPDPGRTLAAPAAERQ